jgi:hypothetical protein
VVGPGLDEDRLAALDPDALALDLELAPVPSRTT